MSSKYHKGFFKYLEEIKALQSTHPRTLLGKESLECYVLELNLASNKHYYYFFFPDSSLRSETVNTYYNLSIILWQVINLNMISIPRSRQANKCEQVIKEI